MYLCACILYISILLQGTFLWDHSLTQVYYSNWANGEPNDYEGDEDCATKDGYYMYQWNDRPCDCKDCKDCKALCQ